MWVDQLDQSAYPEQTVKITVNLYVAKTQLSTLVDLAAQGEEIVIAKAGKPMAKLVPFDAPPLEPRKFGQNLLGITHVAPDFDALLPDDIVDDFYNGPIEPQR
jgi:prevent-host-death family protein